MTTEDPTQVREAHEDLVDRLRKSEELYARAFLGNPVAMSITNGTTGRLTQINTAFADLLGYSRSELIGRTSDELGLWPNRSRRDAIGEVLAKGEAPSLVAGCVRRKDGVEVPVLAGFRLLDVDHSPSVLSVLVPVSSEEGLVPL